MPTIRLTDDAVTLLEKYHWSGNIRQLRNIAEQVSVLEQNRTINAVTLHGYLPNIGSNLPAVIASDKKESDFANEREILYKVLFDMKGDLNDLKKLTMELMQSGNMQQVQKDNEGLIRKIYRSEEEEEEVRFDQPVTSNTAEVLEIPSQSIILQKKKTNIRLPKKFKKKKHFLYKIKN